MFNKLHYYGVYVAGGCLRDLVLYKKDDFKDVDIFAPIEYRDEVLRICHHYLSNYHGPGSGGEKFNSYKFSDKDDGQYDVVFVENTEEWIDTFDLSVNRIWAELSFGYIYMKEDAAQYLEDGSAFIYVDNFGNNVPRGTIRRRIKRILNGVREKYICSSKYKNLHSPLLHEEVKKGAARSLMMEGLAEVYTSESVYTKEHEDDDDEEGPRPVGRVNPVFNVVAEDILG